MPVVHNNDQLTETTSTATANQPTLLVENLSFSYPDGREALRGVSLQINPCEKASLLSCFISTVFLTVMVIFKWPGCR